MRPGREHDTTPLRAHTEILPSLVQAGDDLPSPPHFQRDECARSLPTRTSTVQGESPVLGDVATGWWREELFDSIQASGWGFAAVDLLRSGMSTGRNPAGWTVAAD